MELPFGWECQNGKPWQKLCRRGLSLPVFFREPSFQGSARSPHQHFRLSRTRVKRPEATRAFALRRFLARPREDRKLLLEAFCALALARAIALCLPFRRIARMIGDLGTDGPASLPSEQEDAAAKVGWAVAAMARYVPWDGRCLTQAIAGWRMLARRGIVGTVYLGVAGAPASSDKMVFHAWLRCGTKFVTGGNGRLHYTVLACFSRREKSHD